MGKFPIRKPAGAVQRAATGGNQKSFEPFLFPVSQHTELCSDFEAIIPSLAAKVKPPPTKTWKSLKITDYGPCCEDSTALFCAHSAKKLKIIARTSRSPCPRRRQFSILHFPFAPAATMAQPLPPLRKGGCRPQAAGGSPCGRHINFCYF